MPSKKNVSTEESYVEQAQKEKKEKLNKRKHDICVFKKAKKYYDIRKNLLSIKDCKYYFCIGQRSNGKSWSMLNTCLQTYKEKKRTFCLIRRWSDDIKLSNMTHLLDPQPIKELFGDNTEIVIKKKAFVLRTTTYDEDGHKIVNDEEIGYYRSISEVMHDKSIELPGIEWIVFDEFLPMQHEIPRLDKDEVNKFINVVTTLTRVYTDIKVVLIGNTTTLASDYFRYFNIDIARIKQGTVKQIDVPLDVPVRLPNGESIDFCKIALEYCEYMPEIAAYTSVYAPRSKMITRGEWERANLAEPPSYPDEHHTDKLLCSLNDPITGRTIGLYIRNVIYATPKADMCGLFATYTTHRRQFIIIKMDSDIHSHYHCTNIKDLTYSTYTNWEYMVDRILDETEIDIINELSMNRVYAESDEAGDRFFYCTKEYSGKDIIELLNSGNKF